jgi:penicillin-binding protein 1C
MEHDAGYYGYGISIGTVELSLENVVQAYKTLTDINNPEKYMIAKILSDGRNRARTFGISSILNTSVPIPVKTGTSTDFRDNWTVSYSPDAIIGVWVGNSDNSPMIEVSGVTGA